MSKGPLAPTIGNLLGYAAIITIIAIVMVNLGKLAERSGGTVIK